MKFSSSLSFWANDANPSAILTLQCLVQDIDQCDFHVVPRVVAARQFFRQMEARRFDVLPRRHPVHERLSQRVDGAAHLLFNLGSEHLQGLLRRTP